MHWKAAPTHCVHDQSIASRRMQPGGCAVAESPVVDGHNLIGGGDQLRVDCALDGVPYQRCPLAAAHRDGGQIDRLELRTLADLEHERPVGARLRRSALNLCAVALQDASTRPGSGMGNHAVKSTDPCIEFMHVTAPCVCIRLTSSQSVYNQEQEPNSSLSTHNR